MLPSPLNLKPYFPTNILGLESWNTLRLVKLFCILKKSYLVRTIKPISSLDTCSWNLCSSVWWNKLNMKSKTVSLRRTLWLTSVQSMMLFSYWRMEVVKPGQITNLSKRAKATEQRPGPSQCAGRNQLLSPVLARPRGQVFQQIYLFLSFTVYLFQINTDLF